MKRFLFWLTQYLPCRIISDNGEPYLERYYVGTILGWRIYIHRFVGSDPARGLHDHPWRKAYSIVLSGWYWEFTRSGISAVRWFNSLTGDTFHRVVLPFVWVRQKGQFNVELHRPHCWTLFMHTKDNVKPWGFLRPIEDVNTFQYLPGTPASGTELFTPYQYTREGDQKEWWKTAPRGRP